MIIAGAGGAAHLPGMLAAQTHLPVLGVPVESSMLRGVDSLLSIVQMPAGVPVGTLAIGPAGAANAALLAIAILALDDAALRDKLVAWRAAQTARVLGESLDGDAAARPEDRLARPAPRAPVIVSRRRRGGGRSSPCRSPRRPWRRGP